LYTRQPWRGKKCCILTGGPQFKDRHQKRHEPPRLRVYTLSSMAISTNVLFIQPVLSVLAAFRNKQVTIKRELMENLYQDDIYIDW
jgi:hypothetical protein